MSLNQTSRGHLVEAQDALGLQAFAEKHYKAVLESVDKRRKEDPGAPVRFFSCVSLPSAKGRIYPPCDIHGSFTWKLSSGLYLP